MNGTFDCKKGRVFVSYKEKQGALNALETMLISKEYHLQVCAYSLTNVFCLVTVKTFCIFRCPRIQLYERMTIIL